ncbi:hypothetical protein CYMTET_51612 [Cymbomonas tetramitiformis]|uniref:Uncharacterized protein n=1 Tax=Cymbomonas tetramitiformis TaxID=36881 RepID=A0AAE0BME8_9CHLO|nr:hypothetical protein CYMTET_51612 [Cymbomonas tetramitiformis]
MGLAHLGYYDTHTFATEHIERENRRRRKWKTEAAVKEAEDKANTTKLPVLVKASSPPKVTTKVLPQRVKEQELGEHFPRLTGRDAGGITKFILDSPIRISKEGRAEIFPKLEESLKLNESQPKEPKFNPRPLNYCSTQTLLSQGFSSDCNNNDRVEADRLQYCKDFCSDTCYSDPQRRRKYGEFAKFAKEATHARITRWTMAHDGVGVVLNS